jgi:hypothetical protein
MIKISFTPSLDWFVIKDLDLSGAILISYGVEMKIHAIRCKKEQFEAISEKLHSKKFTFTVCEI